MHFYNLIAGHVMYVWAILYYCRHWEQLMLQYFFSEIRLTYIFYAIRAAVGIVEYHDDAVCVWKKLWLLILSYVICTVCL